MAKRKASGGSGSLILILLLLGIGGAAIWYFFIRNGASGVSRTGQGLSALPGGAGGGYQHIVDFTPTRTPIDMQSRVTGIQSKLRGMFSGGGGGSGLPTGDAGTLKGGGTTLLGGGGVDRVEDTLNSILRPTVTPSGAGTRSGNFTGLGGGGGFRK